MATKAGNNCYFYYDDADLSAYITNCSIELKGKTLVDVTAMGAGHKVWASDELGDVSFTIDFLFDDTAVSGPWILLEENWDKHTSVTYQIRPLGSGTYPLISGSCFIETLPLAVPIGDVVRMNGVVFKHTGDVTVQVEA